MGSKFEIRCRMYNCIRWAVLFALDIIQSIPMEKSRDIDRMSLFSSLDFLRSLVSNQITAITNARYQSV